MGVFIFAMSLGIDALGIGISYGIRHIRAPVIAKIIIAMISALFTGASLLVGGQIAEWLPGSVSNLIGVALLFLMGCGIIYQECRPARSERQTKVVSEKGGTVFQCMIKSLGITIQIVCDPKGGDLDASHSIEPLEAVYLGIALSVDSIGAGIGIAVMGLGHWMMPPLVAAAQFLFLTIGSSMGERLAKSRMHSKPWGVLSGCLLITMAVIKLAS